MAWNINKILITENEHEKCTNLEIEIDLDVYKIGHSDNIIINKTQLMNDLINCFNKFNHE